METLCPVCKSPKHCPPVPGNAVLNAAELFGDKFRFVFHNYGENISKKAADIDEKLKNIFISYEIRDNIPENPHCGGWVDFGDLRKKRNDPVLLFAKCASIQKLHFCFTISNGLMMPCAPYRRMTEMGMLRDQVNKEFLNLYDDTLSDEEQRHILKHILNSNSLKACAYCDGLTDDSVRYQPAEQLKKEEFACIKNGACTYHEVLEMLESDKKL